ncbi:hypothetical protein [Paenibacillus macerans]|uniref:hypothetical protein n=1 Tax=Paenibacillus macerans TaxID=44252 RepID=UPI0037CB02D9
MLSPEQEAAVVVTVYKHLYTPYGLYSQAWSAGEIPACIYGRSVSAFAEYAGEGVKLFVRSKRIQRYDRLRRFGSYRRNFRISCGIRREVLL